MVLINSSIGLKVIPGITGYLFVDNNISFGKFFNFPDIEIVEGIVFRLAIKCLTGPSTKIVKC